MPQQSSPVYLDQPELSTTSGYVAKDKYNASITDSILKRAGAEIRLAQCRFFGISDQHESKLDV